MGANNANRFCSPLIQLVKKSSVLKSMSIHLQYDRPGPNELGRIATAPLICDTGTVPHFRGNMRKQGGPSFECIDIIQRFAR